MVNKITEKAATIIGMDEMTFYEKEDVLEIYLDRVNDELEEALGENVAKSVKDSLKVQMLVEKYNRQGTEVLQTYNYSGVSETFLNGYSQSIQDAIESYKKKAQRVRFL